MGGDKTTPNFAQALIDEVMPQVEKQYRVTKDRQERVIAGCQWVGRKRCSRV
jgi:enterochelin esterase-like enzyme